MTTPESVLESVATKQDIADLETNVAELNANVAELNANVADLKVEIAILKVGITRLETHLMIGLVVASSTIIIVLSFILRN